MQKGQDAELSSKLQQQRLKEVSDQQWRLSVIDDSATRSVHWEVSISAPLTRSSRPSSITEISYEPSYSAFESQAVTNAMEREERMINRGRKTYGSFVPDVDVCLNE
jgi:hypothetical protein